MIKDWCYLVLIAILILGVVWAGVSYKQAKQELNRYQGYEIKILYIAIPGNQPPKEYSLEQLIEETNKGNITYILSYQVCYYEEGIETLKNKEVYQNIYISKQGVVNDNRSEQGIIF